MVESTTYGTISSAFTTTKYMTVQSGINGSASPYAGLVIKLSESSSNKTSYFGTKSYRPNPAQGDRVKPLPYHRYAINAQSYPFSHTTYQGFALAKYEGAWVYGRTHIVRSGRADGNPITYANVGSNDVRGGISEDPITRGEADAKALNKLIKEKVNISENLLQVKKTASSMMSTSLSVLNAFRDIRKGRINDGLNHLSSAFNPGDPSNWLQLQYGWLPLLSDIYASSKVIDNIMADRTNLVVRVDAVSKRSTEPSLSPVVWTKYSISGTATYGTRVGYVYQVKDPTWNNLASLGLSNPALILWENLPYTFVIDWILGVSNYLEALGAARDFDLLQSYASTFSEFDIQINGNAGYFNQPFNVQEGTLPKWKYSGRGTKRVISTPPSPGLTFKLGLNPRKLANLAALIAVR